MRNRWLSALPALALLAAVLVVGTPAIAQTTGSIEGTVADSNGAPLPGVSVDIKSPALLGTRTVVTDAAGRYKFPAIPPGVYTVTAALSGFTKAEKTNVRVGLGGTVTLPVTLSVSIKEEVIVTGEAPVVDTTRTVIGSNTTLEAIQKLPLGRNFTSIATTVAGTGASAGGGISVYGATGLENQYIIDGVNTTGVKIGDQGKQMNAEFVQEVEVKTGGYEAEYSRALGGVINVVTKSGGNEFHGDVFGYYDDDSLTADDKRVEEKDAVSLAPYVGPTRYDIGADLGGFLMKDRIWFWAGYNHVKRTEDTEMYTGRDPLTGSTTPSGDPNRYRLAVTDTTKRNLFSGKLTFRLGEAHTLAVSAFGDPGSFDGIVQGIVGNPKANLGTTDFGGTDFSAKWDGIFGTKFLAQVQASRHEEESKNYPLGSESVVSARNIQFGVSNWYSEGSPYIVREDYQRDNYKAALTVFLGNHEIKGGIDYEDIQGNYYAAYAGGARVSNVLLADGSLNYVSDRYFAKVRGGGPNCQWRYDANGNLVKGDYGTPGPGNAFGIESIYDCAGYEVADAVINTPETKNMGFFFQDSWKIFPNLTINAGIRYDDQKLKDADGNDRIKLSDEWSPRLGVVWDFTNNGKSKFFAHYGRYYTVIPSDIQTRALGNEYTVFAYNYSQGVLDPVDSSAGYAYIQGGQITVDGLKGMYQDEYVAGVEYELFKNWSFGVKGIYKSLGRAIEDRCDLSDARLPYLADYIPAGSLTTCALVNPGGMGDIGNLKDPSNPECVAADGTLTGDCESTQVRRFYRGVELTATHRFSNNFYVLANYVYSSLKGNYDGNEKQSTGQQDPNINADFDYIDLVPNNFGRLSLDRKHQFKLSGNYSFPFGVSVGANFRYNSGSPYAVRGYARNGYTSELYLTPGRGAVGDLPSQYEMDLHAEYNLRLGSFTITPILDIFNLLNRQGDTDKSGVFNTLRDGTRNGLQNRYNSPDPTFGAASRNDAAACAGNVSLTNYACSTNRNYQKITGWQDPLQLRVGARISF
jgi:outer membrane receptor protein involved in Fe transport